MQDQSRSEDRNRHYPGVSSPVLFAIRMVQLLSQLPMQENKRQPPRLHQAESHAVIAITQTINPAIGPSPRNVSWVRITSRPRT